MIHLNPVIKCIMICIPHETNSSDQEDDLKKLREAPKNLAETCIVPSSTFSRYKFLFEKAFFADCQFHLQDKQGNPQVVKAHKVILGMASPVFEAMFLSSTFELQEEVPIVIKEFDAEIFEAMLRFLYYGEITIETCLEALEVALISDKYMIEHLKKIALQKAAASVTYREVWSADLVADLLNDFELQERVHQILSDHTVNCLKSEEFMNCTKQQLTKMLKLDYLSVSEMFIVESCINWCKERASADSSITSMMKDFLPHLRLFTIKLEDMSYLLQMGLFLEDNQCTQLLLMHSSNMHDSVPDFCSPVLTHRGLTEKLPLDVEVVLFPNTPRTEHSNYVCKVPYLFHLFMEPLGPKPNFTLKGFSFFSQEGDFDCQYNELMDIRVLVSGIRALEYQFRAVVDHNEIIHCLFPAPLQVVSRSLVTIEVSVRSEGTYRWFSPYSAFNTLSYNGNSFTVRHLAFNIIHSLIFCSD